MSTENNQTSAKTNQDKWDGDYLNRSEEGRFLQNYLINKFEKSDPKESRNFVLNINADWGTGKTFFLTHLSEDLKKKRRKVIYFDAWKNDFSDNPLMGFIAEIEQSLKDYMAGSSKTEKVKKYLSIFKKFAVPMLIKGAVKKATNHSIDELLKIYEEIDEIGLSENDLDKNEGTEKSEKESNEDKTDQEEIKKSVSGLATKAAEELLKTHTGTQNSIGYFRKNLAELVKVLGQQGDIELPLFILVDELDRCRPNYAIELLETIKHLFAVDGVYFIVATASHQLSHSINAIYGNKFESKRYLNRFFNQEYRLAKPKVEVYCLFLWKKFSLSGTQKLIPLISNESYDDCYGTDSLNIKIICLLAEFTKSSLRDIEQAMILLEAITLSETGPYFTLLIMFLAFCKIRHPELYLVIETAWPKPIDLERHQSLIINNFDETIELKRTVNGNPESMRFFNVINDIQQNHGKCYGDISDFGSSIGGCAMRLDKDEMKNHKFDISHYIDLIERVARLGN